MKNIFKNIKNYFKDNKTKSITILCNNFNINNCF